MFLDTKLMIALKMILDTETEFSEESFVELNEAQLAAFHRDHGDPGERIYRVVHFEPSATRSDDGTRVVVELSIMTESERQYMLDAVAFIYDMTCDIPDRNPSFVRRLEFLRSKFRTVVISVKR